ncbi:MAG: ABC transporter permease [Leeuwenhoekiella sp.]|nr:MAG: ABC transporter permease [Leeuwenhoekiella sp.]
MAADDPIKVGVLLPFVGTYAHIGNGIERGLRLAIEEQGGGKLGGRDVEYVTVDSEMNPGRSVTNAQKLISGEQVDVVVGPVHSGVAMGLLKVARRDGTPVILPNAALNAATRELCAPHIFRTSFSMWQNGYSTGQSAWDEGHKKVITLTWDYSAGKELMDAFGEAYTKAGGEVVGDLWVPFPNVEFQHHIAEIARVKPDAVYVYFAGGAATKFIKEYHASGLDDTIPLMGPGFLTDSLEGIEEAAEGIKTTLFYTDTLANPYNKAFREAYKARFNEEADIYAVQGYDSGTLLVRSVEAVNGKVEDRKSWIEAMENVTFESSPRGPWSFSEAHNPVQDYYLLEVRNGKNEVLGLAVPSLADPATGCSMVN